MLENLLDPLEGEDPAWHGRFLIFVDVLKEGPHVFRSALKRVYELAPTQGKKMPNSWYEKARENKWEERAQAYLLARNKERLRREREKILEETEKGIEGILALEQTERLKRLKTTSVLANALLIYADVLELTAKNNQQNWVEQLADVRTHSMILKQVGDALAKIQGYQPEEFEAGKNSSTETEISIEVD